MKTIFITLILLPFAALSAGFESSLHLAILDVKSNNVNALTCNIKFNEYLNAFTEENLQHTQEDLLSVVEASWQLRMALHKKQVEYSNCRAQIRSLFYQLRSVEDLSLAKLYQQVVLTGAEIDFQNQPIPLKENDFYKGYLANTGRFETMPAEFQSGDILVTRGTSFFSAMLSNISENKGQYSHFVLLHKSEQGTVESIESYAQTGGVSRFAIDYALKNENARILLLRAKNDTIANHAAKIMYERVLEGEKDSTKKITYDFYIDLQDESKMTCSEIAYWGYFKASNGSVSLPEEKSNLHSGLEQIFKQTGIKPDPMLSPQDIEVDSRFEMLAEFRDFRLISDTRYRDIVLLSVFDWMKHENYKMQSTANSLAIDYLIYPLRRTPLWPLVKAVTGAPDFPLESPKGFVKTLKQLNDISDVLYKKLRDEDERYYKQTGWGMTLKQLSNVLNIYKIQDSEAYVNRKSNDFHYFFRPDILKKIKKD